MMRRYAAQTQVTDDRSRLEIERILKQYGAEQFGYAWKDGKSTLGFRMKDRLIRFELPLPLKEEMQRTETGRLRRSSAIIDKAVAQEGRRRWRALALAIKAKLECVSSGIATFEEEFLAYVVMPNGQRIGELVAAPIADAYRSGKMKALLPGTP